MDRIVQNLKDMGKGKLVALGAAALIVALSVALAFGMFKAPVYSTLYAGLSPSEAAKIVSTLESANIDVDVSMDSTVVSVQRQNFAEAKMLLAQNELPSQVGAGWELFDEAGALGMNAATFDVNMQRALEGELARSIVTLQGVENARVHISMPKREAFSRERPEATASVIIKTPISYSMNKEAALAIRHLVASSIPTMQAKNVSVITSDGQVVIAEDGSSGVGEVTLQSAKSAQESQLAARVEKMLAARVGAGNVRAHVSIDVVTERRVMRIENFDPEQQVVRSTETSSESSENQDSDQSSVSVANNIPEALQDGPSASGSRSTQDRNSEVVNYEIGNTITEVVQEPGDIKRLTVAVLVNGIFERDGSDVEYVERTEDELQVIDGLVKAAIGFDAGRGDEVKVESLRFMDQSMDLGEPIGQGIMDILSENIMTIVQYVFALLAIVLIALLMVRPLLNTVAPKVVTVDPEVDEDGDPIDPADAVDAGGDAAKAVLEEGETLPIPDAFAEEQDALKGANAERNARLTGLRTAVDENMEDAGAILKEWVKQK